LRNNYYKAMTVGAICAVSVFALPAVAAPVPGFEAIYQAVRSNCTPPAGSPERCELAINAYARALVEAGVEPDVALRSFTALRAEVAVAGGGDVIEALFEQLLPESGATGEQQASPV